MNEELMMVIAVRRYAGRVVGLCGFLLLIAAPAASAATERFASPSGSGTECTRAAPCEIVTAVNSAASGDDITIEPGTYGSPTPLATTLDDGGNTLTIHGQAGQPRPIIISTAGYGIELGGENSSVSDLDLEDSTGEYGIYSYSVNGNAIDDVISHVSAAKALACYPSGTLTDSVCWSSGSSGIAATLLVASNATATLRNDTLIASGSGGTAVSAHAFVSTMTINLTNSIARGAGADISVHTELNATAKAIVNADHSNYANVQISNEFPGSTTSVTPAGSATNQTGAPAFVDEAAGNFHELSSSTATIGQGIDSPLDGTTDLDGNPRELDGTTDIGAYEFIPPPTSTTVAAPAALPVASPIVAPLSAPTLSGLSETANRWREGNALAQNSSKKNSKKKLPLGTTFSFNLNEAAIVTLQFTESTAGRRSGKTCAAKTTKNQSKHRCTRTILAGTLTLSGYARANKVTFDGLLSNHNKLKPGSYTLTATATASNEHSTPATLHFTIAKG
jgi:hypothetical protein